jgi:hypothetical protein
MDEDEKQTNKIERRKVQSILNLHYGLHGAV